MWLGMVKAALGQLDAVVPGAGAVASALGPLTRLPVAWIDWLAERFAGMPGGTVALPLGSGRSVAVAYALIGAAALAAGRVARPVGAHARAARPVGAHARAALAEWRRLPRSCRLAAAALAAAALALGAAPALSPPPWPERVTVRFLDVGQGDSTLVQHPDGAAVLFDGGPPEAQVATLLRRLGVRRLALVVATHRSRDHHGGLAEVLDRVPVGLLLDGGDGTRDPSYLAMLAVARRKGIRRLEATAPLDLRAGGLAIRVRSPPPRRPGPAPEDPNPRAVVATVSAGGFDLFLSADAESDALERLELPDVDAMKVPHHGSADPGLPELLERLKPEAAAIEVGAGNTYGHPEPATLRALRAAGVPVWRTDRDGTVTLTAEANGLAVETAP
jgi:competence protein ComEC